MEQGRCNRDNSKPGRGMETTEGRIIIVPGIIRIFHRSPAHYTRPYFRINPDTLNNENSFCLQIYPIPPPLPCQPSFSSVFRIITDLGLQGFLMEGNVVSCECFLDLSDSRDNRMISCRVSVIDGSPRKWNLC